MLYVHAFYVYVHGEIGVYVYMCLWDSVVSACFLCVCARWN